MEVIGFKHKSFKPEDSDREISGFNLYLTYDQKDVEGLACERIFLSDAKMGGYEPVIGDKIVITYNRYGKPASIDYAV